MKIITKIRDKSISHYTGRGIKEILEDVRYRTFKRGKVDARVLSLTNKLRKKGRLRI